MLTGRRMFFYFAAFFGLIFCMNAVMITLATRSHRGVVTDHAYEKGLAYNDVVSAEAAQEKLGWQSTTDYADGVLTFVLKDKNGSIVQPNKATATFTRPTQSGMDFSVELTGEKTPIHFPAKGLWHVRVDAVVGEHAYQQSVRIIAP